MKKYSLVMKWSYKYDKESTWIEHDDGENRYELEEGAVHPLPHIGDRELEILAVRAEGDVTVVELRIDGRELSLQSGEEPAVTHVFDDYMVCGDSVSQSLCLNLTVE